MRVALLSDIHGNEVALRAVLGDITRLGVDEIVCLGDVATLGPNPQRTVEQLRDLNCLCIMGNHDAFLLEPALLKTYTEAAPIIEAVNWCKDQLSRDSLAYLATFKSVLEIPLGVNSTLLLYHGSPRSNVEEILATTSLDELETLLAGWQAAIMAGGHTHLQMLRQYRDGLLVNVGSVGMPFKEYVAGRRPTVLAHAEYAVVEEAAGRVSVALHRVPLDKEALRQSAAGSRTPLREWLIQQYS